MGSVLLAALTAAIWGAGDFSGGKATQRTGPAGTAMPGGAAALRGPVVVTTLSQLTALPVLVLLVLLMGGGTAFDAGGVGWGFAGGVAGFGGIVLLYWGLAQGAMVLFAPITAVTAAVVPLGAGLLLDRVPSTAALFGVGCAIAAIGLVSLHPGERGVPGGGGPGGGGPGPAGRSGARLVALALLTGAMFGVFFTLVSRAGPDAGMWPLVGMRAGSVAVGLLCVVLLRAPLRAPGRAVPWLVTAGVLDTVANALYVAATAHGDLSIVAPIASLYPVSTVLLALIVDRERVHPVQLAGLGLAATALVLVAG